MPVTHGTPSYFEGDVAGTATSIAVPKPPGLADGDVLICHASIAHDYPGDVTAWTMSGWTYVGGRETPGGQTYPSVAMFRKSISNAGSEPANYTITRPASTGTSNVVASIEPFTGVDSSNPILDSPSFVSGPTGPGAFGAITPSVVPALVCWYYANRTIPRFNLIPRPSGTDATGWQGNSETAVSRPSHPEGWAIRANAWTGPYSDYLGTPLVAVAAGERVSAVCTIEVSRAQTISIGYALYNNGSYVVVQGGQNVALAANTPTIVRFNLVLAAGTYNQLSINLDGPSAQSGDVFYMSAARAEKVDDSAIVYRDGNDPGWGWDGTPGVSASRSQEIAIAWTGTGLEQSEVANTHQFQGLFTEYRTGSGAAGTRTVALTEWNGVGPSTVAVYSLREAPAGTEVQVPAVDLGITLNALTSEIAQVARPQPVDVTTTLLAPTVEMSVDVMVDVPPVDIAATLLAPDGSKVADVLPVDVGPLVHPLDPAYAIDVPPVDLAQSFPDVIELVGNVAAPVDLIVTTVMPIDPAHRIDGFDPLGVSAQVLPVTLARVLDVEPVDIAGDQPQVLAYSTDFAPLGVSVEVLPVTVAFSTDTTAAQRGAQVEVISHPARIFAQRILTGEWLHTDLSIADLEVTRTLSGAQLITGNFPAEVRDLADIGLEGWATWVHVEQNDTIRGSGILQPTKVDTGQKLALEAVGVSAYAHGIPYLGENYDGIQVDPADMVRKLWDHLQSFPDAAPLGVQIAGTTPVRIGTEPEDVEFETGAGEQVSFTAGPYKLHWYEGTDSGSEIDKLAKDTPFEFTEYECWNDPVTKDYVQHWILIHHPRAGRRRSDLVFAQDENLLNAFGPEENPGTWASQVVLFGKGEGSTTVRGYGGGRSANRVRRVATLDDKTVSSTGRANALAQEDWQRRQASRDITELMVRAHHRNARLGSYAVGDDVPVVGDVPHWGWIDQYERILSYTWAPGQETVRIQCRRAESFAYGSPA